MGVDNPFVGTGTVARYAAGRPYHHARTVRRALGDRRPERTLDLACGTGLSTRALAELGVPVVGADVEPAMVTFARRATGLPFAVGSAEALPVGDGVVDLVTVGSGVHWFDAGRFAAEVVRVLRPGGLLLAYDHVGGRPADEPEFEEWLRGHLRRHPAPPRGRPTGLPLPLVAEDSWPDAVPLDRDGYADYLMSQSNVARAGDALREELRTALTPFFPGRRTVVFTASYQLYAAPES